MNMATRLDKETVQVVGLDCDETFHNLNPNERLYAHYMAQAFFQGALIFFLQYSPESAGIFVLLYHIFSAESIEQLRDKAGINELEWHNFVSWSASKLSNRKIHVIPSVSYAKMWKLVASSAAVSALPELLPMYENMEKAIFSCSPPIALGFPTAVVAKKNPKLVNQREYNTCNEYILRKKLRRPNTRFYKDEIDGVNSLRIKLASAKKSVVEETYKGIKVKLESGCYAEILSQLCEYLRKAGEYAATVTQRNMLNTFALYFENGNHEAYINANKLWFEDVNPSVKSRLDFVENSIGHPGQRSGFEGFVATVNKESLRKFSNLVTKTDQILKKLPWGRDYEKDEYTKPDFTVMEIIAFGYNGLITGKNFSLPNSGTMGSSHVFSNIISAIPENRKFIKNEDQELMRGYRNMAHELMTGLHELYGHGSGKLFTKNANGSFNFNKDNTVDILTGGKVTSWYNPGQSFKNLFGAGACAFEECRAYAVALLLCCEEDIHEIMSHESDAGRKIKYVIWLKMLRDGVLGVEAYDAVKKNWLSDHCWARFVLVKVVLEAGEGLLTIEQIVDFNGNPDLLVTLDEEKIDSVGVPAMRDFLKKLQAHKSTADVKGATALFDQYSIGPTELKWRTICVATYLDDGPLLFVQPNTVLNDDGEVLLKVYPQTPEGVIQSVLERYTPESVANLEKLWKAEKK